MADTVTEEHRKIHGEHPAARRCGTHLYNLKAEQGRHGLSIPRLVMLDEEPARYFGQKVIQANRARARRRAAAKVARASRKRNRA